ncbi:PH domain-containing protein [Streptomyces sp. NBC_01808]|uniref:PH domain-containing protein n=1 Tax=Streptomyces sp. NBC_01808 TaxID=2975947 RepID=UPI002DDA4554|nr:PH domain-containing protein [Streptomyces sp. NBC_01808]WSA39596.1 PH domain-containing protein [Streptomyces sp. NBC_01808]
MTDAVTGTGQGAPAERTATPAGTPDPAPAAPRTPAPASARPDPAPPDPATDWRRLDPRSLLVTAQLLLGAAFGAGVPVGAGLAAHLDVRAAVAWVLAGSVLLLGGGLAVDVLRLRHTRYRVGAERVELRTGVLFTSRRSLPRDRIRTVDLTAHPLLRLLGLVKVRIGTGDQTAAGESALQLTPVRRAEGESLRRALLRRDTTAAPAGDDPRLATLSPGWIRYAPLSFLTPLLALTGWGAVMQVSQWFGAEETVVDWVRDTFSPLPALWTVLALGSIALVTGFVGSLGLWTEMWWNYRLEREPDGTLRVRRGLLTTRSISLEEARLRGVDVVEPLGVRLSGAARVEAIATGLSRKDGEDDDLSALLPAAPRAVVDDVTARVLRAPVALTRPELAPHPRAALARRLRWSLGAALVPVAVLVALGAALSVRGLLYAGAVAAAVLLPAAALLARDAYRSLGHGLAGPYLVVRSGTLRRSTVALRRDGVVGWTVRQSLFQRRAGLVTLRATTAAGAQAYAAYDVGEAQGLRFAAEAVPELLTPFLVTGAGAEGPAPAPVPAEGDAP